MPRLASLCPGIAPPCPDQSLLFQIDYFRDPMRVNTTSFKQHSQLAAWNNEGDAYNATYKENFGKVQRFIMIKVWGMHSGCHHALSRDALGRILPD